jgi:hypothetical protein
MHADRHAIPPDDVHRDSEVMELVRTAALELCADKRPGTHLLVFDIAERAGTDPRETEECLYELGRMRILRYYRCGKNRERSYVISE